MKTIVVIPARGGSKGIPRKSIRPVAGRPMLSWAIHACLQFGRFSRIVVSTDDAEMALLGERLGAEIVMRPAELARDEITIDPVVVHAVRACETRHGERYDLVFTVQPTSPLVSPSDFAAAFALFESDTAIQTVLSVVDDRHLSWTVRDGQPVPLYAARVNRQALPPVYRETGAVIACTGQQLHGGTRIGEHVGLLEIPAMRAFDIDTQADLAVCDFVLRRKRVVFVATGHREVGLGHVYRALTLAQEMVQHEVRFVCDSRSTLAAERIARDHWDVETAPEGELLRTVLAHDPHLVVNDILDTDADYVIALRNAGCRIVNFEDLGDGARHADLVVNALYPHLGSYPNVLAGSKWFCLRDEFIYTERRPVSFRAERLLVTFGGVDEGDLTARILEIVAPLSAERGTTIDVVVGPGYAHADHLDDAISRARRAFPSLTIHATAATARISDHMRAADLAITSGGRTVLELASLAVPTIVICQNQRELTHIFAGEERGICNLGWHRLLEDERIGSTVASLLDDPERRSMMAAAAAATDLASGKRRVVERLLRLLEPKADE